MENEEESQKAFKVLKFLKDKRPDLTINRVPEDTKRKFVEMADAEYCSDYGMLLKALVDSATDARFEEFNARLDGVQERLTALESKKSRKTLKMADGSVIEKR